MSNPYKICPFSFKLTVFTAAKGKKKKHPFLLGPVCQHSPLTPRPISQGEESKLPSFMLLLPKDTQIVTWWLRRDARVSP